MLQILADSLMVATRLGPDPAMSGRARPGDRAAPMRGWRWLGWLGRR